MASTTTPNDSTNRPNEKPLGATDPAQPIRATVHLVPRTPLPSAHALSAEPLATRRYLTRAELAAEHGADPDHLHRVNAFAKASGLQVIASNPAERTVTLEGSAADFARAFKTNLVDVDIDGKRCHRPDAPLALPSEIAPFTLGVTGLDSRPAVRRSPARSESSASIDRRPFNPAQVAELYQFPNGYDGTGQTIALIEMASGNAGMIPQLDIALTPYWQNQRISPAPSVTGVSVKDDHDDGPPSFDYNNLGEVLLDISMVGCIAPGAKIVVYFAPNSRTANSWIAAVKAAINDTTNNPDIISISWGLPEYYWEDGSAQVMDSWFQTAALRGISVFVSSGDHGSSDGYSGYTLVEFPASSPHCTACGGTSIQVAGSTITSEVVWHDGKNTATGGGVSDIFPVPPYQEGIKVPASPNTKKPGRGVPDVAGNADQNPGYHAAGEPRVGGTSAVAPLWAALAARLNQALGKNVGFLNPMLYGAINAAGGLSDIVEGNNITNGSTDQWVAGPGWDPCTGLGSPKGNVILEVFQKQTKPTPKAG